MTASGAHRPKPNEPVWPKAARPLWREQPAEADLQDKNLCDQGGCSCPERAYGEYVGEW
jgi:hypothetical protein